MQPDSTAIAPLLRRTEIWSLCRGRLPAFPSLSSETCIIWASLFFTVLCNGNFWSAWSAGRDWSAPKTWLLLAAMALLLTAIHCLLLGLVVGRRTAKPILSVLFLLTALAIHYMGRYTVYFDMSMVRNIYHTDVSEARDLLSMNLLVTLLAYGALPALFLSRCTFSMRPRGRALLTRLAFMGGTLTVAVISAVLIFQDLSALLRNQKEMRYLITPANFIVSSLRLAIAEKAEADTRIPVGTDARLASAWSARKKPLLLVVVVGETARAANWGLNGYTRQTTPELAALDVINFPNVVSCGTNTEVSLPCMFSPIGRRHYDERSIRRHESVLHVLEHGGIKTIWRDNQSGCKGVCSDLELQRPDRNNDPVLCTDGRCLDEILLTGLEAELRKNQRGMVLVLHQMGNHGPAYSKRYPPAFRRFTPTCETADLGQCSRAQITNSYDNALLYTDHFLSETIRRLQSQRTHEAAMIYLSDHGESLGENGLYLHGLPYPIAPREQTEVPMVMWLSEAFAASSGIDVDCLKSRARQPLSHDYLFHSLLGLMQVRTAAYQGKFDLSADCQS